MGEYSENSISANFPLLKGYVKVPIYAGYLIPFVGHRSFITNSHFSA